MNYLIWIALSLALLGGAWMWMRYRIKLRRARSWPSCNGSVVTTVVRLEGVGTEQRYMAEMNYSYAIEGVSYFGHVRRSFMLHGRAHGWAGIYPTGRRLQVRYNPANAGDSVVFEDEQVEVQTA